jgi:hypothetical protein
MSNKSRQIKLGAKNICKFFFIGYGWQAFLFRLSVIVISFKLNPLDSASHEFTTGAMKLWLLTCFFTFYTIFKLIADYRKRGQMFQAEQEHKEGDKNEG